MLIPAVFVAFAVAVMVTARASSATAPYIIRFCCKV